jgi:hypothetical protein
MANPIKGAVAGVKLVNLKTKVDGKKMTVNKAIKGAIAGLKKPSTVVNGLAMAKGARAATKKSADPKVQAKLKAAMGQK